MEVQLFYSVLEISTNLAISDYLPHALDLHDHI
jgi:hypothetical protein